MDTFDVWFKIHFIYKISKVDINGDDFGRIEKKKTFIGKYIKENLSSGSRQLA
ncbi:hypothetical protein LEP1GSC175_1689 [Leptospira santarosai str. HAI821]|uniref:Uncharacterized protein n=1 Tax=Leptospira santarosai serovar Shermani str. LT 821 TaxID=758847 RepID=K8Y7C6_9LEPT|nr:hypothetical protein LEP1GSC068_1997 [Leptospira sp. Fiocruz LV3954]EKT85670.1 hypothetical protein LSS_16391 [Leptospira santarosai serovar Shermani str. LT 821]EMI69146.1 hypothetical protein LEP1GSC076_2721 [Leptospira sp. Fiocruz LV4135]EMO15418.1 hypothetical protein LEP1GSC165_0759 [Leptospira santarosai str. CBC523]EMO33033.1 hypothetical protein LEP1GSC175_1689 [Leptospira santarosai str. HAI821]EPG82416.1 hypothetical protein LEP1GSC048_3742 [Leptospira santarosai serovar Shermani 